MGREQEKSPDPQPEALGSSVGEFQEAKRTDALRAPRGLPAGPRCPRSPHGSVCRRSARWSVAGAHLRVFFLTSRLRRLHIPELFFPLRRGVERREDPR